MIQLTISGEDLAAFQANLGATYELFQGSGPGKHTIDYPAPTADPTQSPPGTPATPTLPETEAAPTVAELDTDGQPWREEIHSGTHSKKTSGQWTQKRGADKALVAKIYAEHNAAVAARVVGGTPTPVPGALAAGVALAAGQPTAPVPAVLAIAAHDAVAPVDPLAAAAPVPAADPVAECIALATQILNSTQDPATKQTIGLRITEAMNASGLADTAALMASPEKSPAVLLMLQVLARECGIQC